MDLVFFGIQGCGKGTQAKKLAAQFGYSIFEAGGALRAIAARATPLGEKVKSYIDEGNLVPHEIIMEVVQDFIANVAAGTQVIFDGIPRDMDQKRDFDTIMTAQGREFRCVNLVLDEDKAFQRIMERSRVEGRADDASVEKIRRRFDIFNEKTSPVIFSYYEAGKVTEVDADKSVDAVYEELLSDLGLSA